MPSVIGTDPTSGVNVAANYLKAFPSTKFGTRELTFAIITVSDPMASDHLEPNSLFSQAVRALQLQAEIYGIGEPTDGEGDSTFIAILSSDTLGNDVEGRNGAWTLAEAMSNALDTSVTITFNQMIGGGLSV